MSSRFRSVSTGDGTSYAGQANSRRPIHGSAGTPVRIDVGAILPALLAIKDRR